MEHPEVPVDYEWNGTLNIDVDERLFDFESRPKGDAYLFGTVTVVETERS